jgi:hypothetical protein
VVVAVGGGAAMVEAAAVAMAEAAAASMAEAVSAAADFAAGVASASVRTDMTIRTATADIMTTRVTATSCAGA